MSETERGKHSAHGKSDGDDSAGTISLTGAVAMGTGVMIGAGIFALTGQIAELAGPLFPLSFVVGGVVTSLAAYSYIKMSNAWPSSGGIAMILQKAYLRGTALEWRDQIAMRDDLPWDTRFIDVEGGTHAADLGTAYRAAMRILFPRTGPDGSELPN